MKFLFFHFILLTTKLSCLQKNKPGHTNFPTNWNDMTFLWFDLSCSTVHVPNAGTLNCMMKKNTEMLEFTPEIILISEV